MGNAKNSNVTPADVAAKAAEEKLVVPAQADPEETTAGEKTAEETPELTVIEGGKKDLKTRVNDKFVGLAGLLGRHKKTLIAVGAAASVAAVAFAKYAKNKAEEALDEEMTSESEEVLKDVKDESEQLAENA